MSARLLLIRFFEGGGSEWGLFGAGGARLEGPEDGLPPAGRAADARLVALAPGECVLLTDAAVPTRNPTRLRRALPYAVEDRLAADVETLHVAAGPRAPDGRVPVAVVARELLESWLSALRGAGLEPDALVPEPLALPASDAGHCVLLQGRRVVARLDHRRGFAGESGLLDAVAPVAGDVPVLDAGGEATDPPGAWAELPRRDLDGPVLALYARVLDVDALNLLQGDYPPRRHAAGTGRLWRVAAVLALGWGVLELGLAASDVWRLERESERLNTRIEAVFTGTLPDARLVDPRAQMARHLETLAGGRGDALALIRRVAPALEEAAGVTVQALEYRSDELTLTLRAGSLAELDRLQVALSGRPGLRAELASAGATERGVDGRLTVRSTGA